MVMVPKQRQRRAVVVELAKRQGGSKGKQSGGNDRQPNTPKSGQGVRRQDEEGPKGKGKEGRPPQRPGQPPGPPQPPAPPVQRTTSTPPPPPPSTTTLLGTTTTTTSEIFTTLTTMTEIATSPPPSQSPPPVPPPPVTTSSPPQQPPSASPTAPPAAPVTSPLPQTPTAPAAAPPPVSVQPTTKAPQSTVGVSSATLIVAPSPPMAQPILQSSTTIPSVASPVPPTPLPSSVSTQVSTTVPITTQPSSRNSNPSVPATSLGSTPSSKPLPQNPNAGGVIAPPPSTTQRADSNTFTAIPVAEIDTPQSRLSTSAKIGIGVGVGIFGILTFLGALFLFLRRRRRKRAAAQGSRLFSEYDPQQVYFGEGGEIGARARRAMQDDGPLPPQPVATAPVVGMGAAAAISPNFSRNLGQSDETRPFSFESEDLRRERMMAPALRSHPVGTRNTLEDLGFPFARRLSSNSSFSTNSSFSDRGALGIVGRSPSTSLDSLTDPNPPFRVHSPSPLDGLRPSITPSESVSRVMAKTYPSVTPSESVSRVGKGNRPSLTPSENFARLFGRKATASLSTEPSRDSNSQESQMLSVAELPRVEVTPAPAVPSRGSMPSWPIPPGGDIATGLRGWLDAMRRKSRASDVGGVQSRWSETQRSSTSPAHLSRMASDVARIEEGNGSKDELITALPALSEKERV